MYLVEKQNNPFQIRKNNRIFVVDSKKLTIMAKEGLTPMMKQFYDLKAKHPDAIMLFRCGDFYETYCEDAVVASEILGITQIVLCHFIHVLT